jgi:hypothetical protein
MSNDEQLPVKKMDERTKLSGTSNRQRLRNESKKWENIRTRKTKFAKTAMKPTVIDARKELEKNTIAARNTKAGLVAGLTKEMTSNDLVDVLGRSWIMSIFVENQGNYNRVLSWINRALMNLNGILVGENIVRSVLSLYPLTVDIEMNNRTKISGWMHRQRDNGLDLIPILVHANRLLLCTRSVMTSTSCYRIIKEILSHPTDRDAAANLCKSIIQLAGESNYQAALDCLTVKYNTKHELIANTCRSAEFYRTSGLNVGCVTNHKNVTIDYDQYRDARKYFQQTGYKGDLPLFFVTVESVTKTGISVKITDDHDGAEYKNNRFLFGRRNGDADETSSLCFTPCTNKTGTATSFVSTPVYAAGRLLFEDGLPAIADKVQLFLPGVCVNIVIQYVQSTLWELISHGE